MSSITNMFLSKSFISHFDLRNHSFPNQNKLCPSPISSSNQTPMWFLSIFIIRYHFLPLSPTILIYQFSYQYVSLISILNMFISDFNLEYDSFQFQPLIWSIRDSVVKPLKWSFHISAFYMHFSLFSFYWNFYFTFWYCFLQIQPSISAYQISAFQFQYEWHIYEMIRMRNAGNKNWSYAQN